MKKVLTLVILINLFLSNTLFAEIGCRIGNYILTSPRGDTFNNGDGIIPIYYYSPGSLNTINKRNWDQDPQCGIMRNIADAYPAVPGTTANPPSKCSPSNNYGDNGKLVYYKPADNSCSPTNVPLDTYTDLLLIASAVVASLFISRKLIT